ncbi:MAG: 50S ribosomal protein L6 [Acidimicrobiales bacterium]|nr:50S ribosomal protein L6 [Acidimicrobiales bacterium]
MSRVGKAPITIPSGVEITLGEGQVSVKGPKGELQQFIPERITVRQDGDEVVIERPDEERDSRALHGLTRALIANMVHGVTNEFTKELEIIGVGYRATAKGPDKLELALGYSHTIAYDAPDGISFEVPLPTEIIVRGVDKQQVGQVAAEIRQFRKPEPYKGKGVRYKGEHVVRKAGKAGK